MQGFAGALVVVALLTALLIALILVVSVGTKDE